MSLFVRLSVPMGAGAALGVCSGLWDLSSAELPGTLLLLGLSGFVPAVLAPRLAPAGVVGVAFGVLLAHGMSPTPLGLSDDWIDRGLISAAVALLPAALGASVGTLAILALTRRSGSREWPAQR